MDSDTKYCKYCGTFCDKWFPPGCKARVTCCYTCNKTKMEEGICPYCCKTLESCLCRRCAEKGCNALISFERKKGDNKLCDECSSATYDCMKCGGYNREDCTCDDRCSSCGRYGKNCICDLPHIKELKTRCDILEIQKAWDNYWQKHST